MLLLTQLLGAGLLGVMGVLAVAVSAEAVYRGRIWYRAKYLLALEARWVPRSQEPIWFWLLTGLYGGIGCTSLTCGVWLAAAAFRKK
jgi:hypothetical protein